MQRPGPGTTPLAMKLKERLVMAALGFTAAVLLLLLLDISLLLPHHHPQEPGHEAGPSKVHGRVKISHG